MSGRPVMTVEAPFNRSAGKSCQLWRCESKADEARGGVKGPGIRAPLSPFGGYEEMTVSMAANGIVVEVIPVTFGL